MTKGFGVHVLEDGFEELACLVEITPDGWWCLIWSSSRAAETSEVTLSGMVDVSIAAIMLGE